MEGEAQRGDYKRIYDVGDADGCYIKAVGGAARGDWRLKSLCIHKSNTGQDGDKRSRASFARYAICVGVRDN